LGYVTTAGSPRHQWRRVAVGAAFDLGGKAKQAPAWIQRTAAGIGGQEQALKIPQRAEQIIPWVQGPRVLDIGCAAHAMRFDDPNWLHGLLCKRFPDTVGLDIRPDLVDQLKGLGFENVYLGNAETFDLGRKFDTIVAGDLVEHLSNPGAFLDRAKKHLAPGGRLIVTSPYPFSLFHMSYALIKYPKTTWNVEHTHWICPQTLAEGCRRVGLRPMHSGLIVDYAPADRDTSLAYRVLVKTLVLFDRLVPERLRGSSVFFVATHADAVDLRPYRSELAASEVQFAKAG
jgi:SAM-dependent methyltransferase